MRFNVKKYFQVLGVTLGVIFLGIFVTLGMVNFSDRTPQEANDGTVAVGDAGVINVLMMCTDNDGLRTDAIMLASFDTNSKSVNMLSIPRDLRMYVGNRYQKINAAHAFSRDGQIGGAKETVETVSRLTGVPIHFYVDFSFTSVAKLIDQLGPINFTVPDLYGDGVGMVYDDPVQNLHINLKPGNQNLNGEQVVHLLRYRKDNHGRGYPMGDMQRIQVQQEFIKTLVDQKLNIDLIFKIPNIFGTIKSEIKTNIEVRDVLNYYQCLEGLTSGGIQTVTVPGDPTNDSANGDVFVPNMGQLKLLIGEMFKDANLDEMWYAEPGIQPELYADGYMTTGGYVRSANPNNLSSYSATEVTNDELCLIRGITQTVTIPEPQPEAAE